MNITKQHDSPMIGIGEGLHTVDLKKKKKSNVTRVKGSLIY